MLFSYKAVDETGAAREGTIDAISQEAAISALQRRNLILTSIGEAGKGSGLSFNLSFFDRVKTKDVVILSRQISTLFEAQVSALRVFRLLAAESSSPLLGKKLGDISDELQGGSSISKALGKHPEVFSDFYANMVRAGEESGKLDEIFRYLADYLDRSYEVTSKVRNALIYPSFVVVTFVAVMILMLTLVIPKLSAILLEADQVIPIYTRIIIALSSFFVNYGVFLLILAGIGGVFLWRFTKTGGGRYYIDSLKISIPYLGDLYRKLYLSRISDNLSTMLDSGIPMVRAVEISASVVGNSVYEKILLDTLESIKGGIALSDALSRYPGEIPGILIQMTRVGEESGELGSILRTLAKFYQREVTQAVDTLVNLIEPIMIVALGLGVGILLAAVLIPIYNIASAV